MEAATDVLRSGQKVVWIDTAGPINRKRFQDVLRKGQPSGSQGKPQDGGEVLHGLLHFHPPTLSHLLALISNPPLGFPPADTGLIVIDSISSLFRAEFRTKLRPSAQSNAGIAGGSSVQDPIASPSLSERRSARWNIKEEKLRWRVIGNILESLKKLSVIYDCAIIVTNEMATRFRPNQKPMLHESLSGPTWDVGIGTKLVLYWMWLPEEVRTQIYSQPPQAVRIAEIIKVGKVPVDGKRKGRVIPFMILRDGLHPFTTEPSLTVIPLEPPHERSSSMPQPPKRKLEQYESPTRTKFETPMSRLAYYTSSPARSPILRNPRPFLDAAAAAEFAEGTEKAEDAETPTGNEQQTEGLALSSQSYIADFAAGSNTEQKDSARKGGAEEGNPQQADTANTSVPPNEQKVAEPIVYDSCDEESITSDMFET
ncbi:hypothetical protein KEM55_002754 [Ascosphaera atra]|nr:hypothetical protein KEM55_002754 [Ascosphaera atra]